MIHTNAIGKSGDIACILSLLLVPGVGAVRCGSIIAIAAANDLAPSQFVSLDVRSLTKMLPAGAHDLAACVAEARDQMRNARLLLDKIQESDIYITAITDISYPERIRAALGRAAPPLLFVRGNRQLLHSSSAAVVGTRQPTTSGRRVAGDCAAFFARNGITVVSGGAEGVDTVAHQSAFENGGYTIIVLPRGLFTYAPPAFLSHAREDAQRRVCIVSQFLPTASWETHAAVTRNATISALARVVCVIEPGKMGGSIRTARIAVQQGKSVFLYGTKATKTALAGSGARELAVAGQSIDEAALLEAWNTGKESAPRQRELF